MNNSRQVDMRSPSGKLEMSEERKFNIQHIFEIKGNNDLLSLIPVTGRLFLIYKGLLCILQQKFQTDLLVSHQCSLASKTHQWFFLS